MTRTQLIEEVLYNMNFDGNYSIEYTLGLTSGNPEMDFTGEFEQFIEHAENDDFDKFIEIVESGHFMAVRDFLISASSRMDYK